MRRGTWIVATALCCMLGSGRAAAAGYSYTNIADSSGVFFDFNSPSINNSGEVAFRASLDVGGSGIYRGSVAGGGATTIAETGDVFNAFQFQTPGIAADGRVAFMGQRRGEAGGGQGIFIGAGGQPVIYALTPTIFAPQPGDFAGFGSAVMSSSGTPAFAAPFVGGRERASAADCSLPGRWSPTTGATFNHSPTRSAEGSTSTTTASSSSKPFATTIPPAFLRPALAASRRSLTRPRETLSGLISPFQQSTTRVR